MNEQKSNIFLEKLNNESIREFEKCIELIDDESEKKNKKLLYAFLYSDVINIELGKDTDGNEENSKSMQSILDDPTYILEDYFNKTISNISYNELNILNEVKKKFQKNKTSIKNKIKECNLHLELLKKFYTNLYLEKFVTNSDSQKLLLENKSVLFIDNFHKRTQLGEFFARYIFASIESKINNKNLVEDGLQDNFYGDTKINSYVNYINEKVYNIKKFNDIHPNFKYWIILLNIIIQVFNTKSNYDILFNEKEFEKHLNELIAGPQKEGDGKKSKKKDKSKDGKKGKAKKGGVIDNNAKLLKNIIKSNGQKNKKDGSKKNSPKDKNKKKPNLQEVYKTVFENCLVKDKTLNNIYIQPYNVNIKTYFTGELNNLRKIVVGGGGPSSPLGAPSSPSLTPPSPSGASPPGASPSGASPSGASPPGASPPGASPKTPSRTPVSYRTPSGLTSSVNISIEKDVIDPFNHKNIKIKNIISTKDKQKPMKNSEILNNLNYNIFQSLKILQFEESKIELNKFMKELKKKLTFILYYLYNTKLKIYDKYLKLVDSAFNLKNNVNNSNKVNKTSNIQANKSSNVNKNTQSKPNIPRNTNSTSKKQNVSNNLSKKISNINAKIESLQNKSGIREYSEKIIELEDQKKQLLIKEYLSSFDSSEKLNGGYSGKLTKINPIYAITNNWIKNICHNHNIKSSYLNAEEIRGQARYFIETILEKTDLYENIDNKIPVELKKKINTKYALTQIEFEKIIIDLKNGHKYSEKILNLLHNSLECYLYKLIKEGSIVAKKAGSKILRPKDINEIRLFYFPQQKLSS